MRRRSKWTGLDTPDFTSDKAPDYVPPPGARGDAALARRCAVHHACATALGWIWVAEGLKDGPLPAHYEPFESPVSNRAVSPAGEPVRGSEVATRQRLRTIAR